MLAFILVLGAAAVVGGCRNTVQGVEWVTDDNGQLCKVEDVDKDGCCAVGKGRGYSCQGCDSEPKSETANCCDIYETCVSCCMSPVNLHHRVDGLGKRRALYPLYRKVETTDVFRYCRARCRTSSRSVHHQNRYKRGSHLFCYGSQLD
eukprot:TRINITY_DN19382_c0_g1_i1.p2 TRINITY_DN19382_c0_g1~~TRINITY_DN19382_c0_g1_i1.p2  ORF type:complete len:148 (+),score=14.18 TRINITY_DN19382_c0_g1_i1:1211-1654(+)